MSCETSHHLLLIGVDVIREFGLVIDYHFDRVYSHIMERYVSSDGHLALEMMPSNSEQGQHPVSRQALSTRQQPRAQERGTLSFESSTFHLREEESEHEHEHTSTSEDDLLKLLGMPEDTQTWTRFDKRAKTHRSTLSSGPLWENVIARFYDR